VGDSLQVSLAVRGVVLGSYHQASLLINIIL
jgi:hypothetical protein